jgi:glycosyltransferase involved in cell wall biosynthesis
VVKQLSRFHHVWVLTSAQNRGYIEAELKKAPLPDTRFYYVSLPLGLERLQRFQGAIQFYAYLWQLKAYFVARGLHRRFHFDLFHHITYANDWMASFIGALLPVLYLRGPGGGAHRTPREFLSEYSLGGRLAERIRTVGQWIFRLDPFFQLGQRRAQTILVCNHEALEAVPRTYRSKAQLFPVNGISATDLGFLASARSLDNKFRVLSAGKLLRIKGFSLAIRAFKLFVDRSSANGTDEEAEFTIIGDGPELPRLQALIDRLGLQARVYFQDWMPRDKLLAAVAACDVFLFPSLRDGGGAVVVEAMGDGKPVICFDIAATDARYKRVRHKNPAAVP